MAINDEFCAIGKVVTRPQFSHKTFDGKKFYFFFMFAKRHSGVIDRFRCVIPHELTSKVVAGKELEIYGEVRTMNYTQDGKQKTMVYVLVKEVYKPAKQSVDANTVRLEGYVCRKSEVRYTPLGKRICDVILAVNHEDKKSSYIPCVFWNASADIVADKNIGDRIVVRGRLQSREYEKDGQIMTAYEVSANEFEV